MSLAAQGLFRGFVAFDVSSGEVPEIGVDAPVGKPFHEQDAVVPDQGLTRRIAPWERRQPVARPGSFWRYRSSLFLLSPQLVCILHVEL